MDKILHGLRSWLDQPTIYETPVGDLAHPLDDGALNALDPSLRVQKVICKCGRPYRLYVDGKFYCANCGEYALLIKAMVSLIERMNMMAEQTRMGYMHQILTKVVEDRFEFAEELEARMDVLEARLDALEAKRK